MLAFRRAYAMSPKPWEDGQLPTMTDDPTDKPRTYLLTDPTEAGMLDLVRGVVML